MRTNPPHSNITNLSSFYRLNQAEREVLEKGLTFIPTPTRFDHTELQRDMHAYHRRLKLLDNIDYESDHQRIPFTNPSNWEPNINSLSQFIQDLIREDQRSLSQFRHKRPH